MRLGSILSVLGVTVAVLAVFAIIAAWAVSVTTTTDLMLWTVPSGVLVAGLVMMVAGRRLGR